MAELKVNDGDCFNASPIVDDSFIYGYGATIKQFKRTLVANNVCVADAIFVISYDDGSLGGRYLTTTSDWHNLVKLVRSSDFLVYCSGVLTTPFELKTFEHPFVLV